MALIVYYSTTSENTHRFVQKLDMESIRIPVDANGDDVIKVNEPYVLIVPTYGGGEPGGAVPKPAIDFLNNNNNRSNLIGVIAAGNTNFGEYYGLAGDVISRKCKVPMLYRFELTGTPTDVIKVKEGIGKLWETLRSRKKQA